MDYPAWQIALELIGTFLAAVATGWLVGTLRRLQHQIHPVPGARVRIRGRFQMYRCRLEEMSPAHWTLGPPLARDDHFPIMPGERIVGEVAVPDGRLLFRTVLEFADAVRGRTWIKPPRRTYLH